MVVLSLIVFLVAMLGVWSWQEVKTKDVPRDQSYVTRAMKFAYPTAVKGAEWCALYDKDRGKQIISFSDDFFRQTGRKISPQDVMKGMDKFCSDVVESNYVNRNSDQL
jgi:hypothetical protein